MKEWCAADTNVRDDFKGNSPILCFVYKNCATDAMAMLSNSNNRASMPGIAASTSSRVDSAAKHIMACKVNSDLMLHFVNESFGNPALKRRELHVNKDKYCVFKNDLVLNVNIVLFPDKSQVAGNGTRAYPSVVSTLGDCNNKAKEFLIKLYHTPTNYEFEELLQETEKEMQSTRVKDFMNYQLMDQMKEYEPEFDQLLFYLPLAGSAFKKVYYDQLLGRAVSKFVPAEDLVVPYYATDLMDCERITHIIKMTENDVLKKQKTIRVLILY